METALQFVQVVVQSRDTLLQTLALTCLGNDACGLGSSLEGIAGELLPMVEHALGEGLATGVGAQISCEALGEETKEY